MLLAGRYMCVCVSRAFCKCNLSIRPSNCLEYCKFKLPSSSESSNPHLQVSYISAAAPMWLCFWGVWVWPSIHCSHSVYKWFHSCYYLQILQWPRKVQSLRSFTTCCMAETDRTVFFSPFWLLLNREKYLEVHDIRSLCYMVFWSDMTNASRSFENLNLQFVSW